MGTPFSLTHGDNPFRSLRKHLSCHVTNHVATRKRKVCLPHTYPPTPSPQTTACWGCSLCTKFRAGSPHIWKEEASSFFHTTSYRKERCKTTVGAFTHLIPGKEPLAGTNRQALVSLLTPVQQIPPAITKHYQSSGSRHLSPCHRQAEQEMQKHSTSGAPVFLSLRCQSIGGEQVLEVNRKPDPKPPREAVHDHHCTEDQLYTNQRTCQES